MATRMNMQTSKMIGGFAGRIIAAIAVTACVCAGSAAQQGLIVKDGDTIAFLGDSITADGNKPIGYINLVMKGLEIAGVKGAKKIPVGAGGHKSNNMLARVDRVCLSKKPTFMTVSCGVNDVWHGTNGVPLEAYMKNMSGIFDKAAAAGVKVVVLTPTMIGEDPGNANNGKLKAYVDWLVAEAGRRGLLLADLNAAMHSRLAELRAEAAAAGKKPSGNLLTRDGVHMRFPGDCMMAWGVLRAFGVPETLKGDIEAAWREMARHPRAVGLNFDMAGAWTFNNYRNRLEMDLAAVEDGAKCLSIWGPSNRCDTAFSMVSRKIAVPAGAHEFVVSVETKGTKMVIDQISKSGSWHNEMTWFDSSGQKLGTQTMQHIAVAVSRRFVKMREWGRIPAGAACCTVRFAFDSPNLSADDSVSYRNFMFEAVPAGTSRADEFAAAWKDDAWARDLLYPPAKRTTPKATLRDDGITLIDGEPFFPIGIYAVCRREFNGNSLDRAFADLKAAGFNFAHTYGNAYDPEFLAAARKYGFKLWVASRIPDRKLLDIGRYEPSILAWYLGDDTSSHQSPQEVMDSHATVKAVDPNRLTCQADPMHSKNAISRYAAYVRATDVFMPEIYPVRGADGDPTDTNCVAMTINDMERVRSDVRNFGDGRTHACWPILQWFSGWSGWRHFPTREQLRATSWAAIIHGAHGITWYTYGGFEDRKKGTRNEGITSTPERWQAISALATEIKRLSPVLLERTPREQPAVTVIEGPALDPLGERPSVTCLLKRKGGKDFLFAVNAAAEPVTARFTLPGGAVRTERFAPFGVLVPDVE